MQKWISDGVKSSLGGGDKQNELISVIMNLISGQSGGLNGLIQQFTSKGMGDLISSWVGTGQNQSISPNQISELRVQIRLKIYLQNLE